MTTTYTYQGGRKIVLEDESTRFVSRASRYCLERSDFRPIESISRHSWSVRSTADHLDDDLARARRLAPAYPAYVVEETGGEFFVTDRFFVRFRHPEDAEPFIARHGFNVVMRVSPRDYLLRVGPSADVLDVVRNLWENEQATVERVDHDLNVASKPDDLPADPMLARQWYFSPVSMDPLVSPCASINCTSAWKANGLGSPDVVVGVIDCGTDLLDRNFSPNKFAGWALFRDGALCTHETCATDFGPDIMFPSNTNHGTLAATLIAASADTYGGVGVAPNCRLLPVKWSELAGGIRFAQSSLLTLIEFLRTRVDVVACSWNTPEGYWPDAISDEVAKTADQGGAHGKGMVWIWSAGNENVPIEYPPADLKDPIAIPFHVSIEQNIATVNRRVSRFTSSLSRLPNVLCVGAVSSLARRCHYANYGTGLSIVAPSNNLHLYGRLEAAGRELIAPFGEEGEPYTGTSAAASLVAGVAALVRSANAELTASQIVSILKRTADKSFDMRPYERCSQPQDKEPDWDVSPVAPFDSGAFRDIGDPDGEWSPWFGFGKVNAGAAVAEALRMRNG